MMDNVEHWENFSDSFSVSSFGRIRKGDFIVPPQKPNSAGYIKITVNKQQYCIHRLVASHFIPRQRNHKYVIHLDGNKLNNSASNLQWSTSKAKPLYQRLKTINYISKVNGQTYYKTSKLSIGDLNGILRLLSDSKLTQQEIANQYNITPQYVSKLKRKRVIYVKGTAIPI